MHVTMDELVRRVERLEDSEALKQLKARYAAICDEGYDPDRLAALFVEDGTWDGGPYGTHHGRDAIRSFFAAISTSFVWALHYVICPNIVVADDGTTATGSWYIWEPVTMTRSHDPSATDAVLLMAQYHDDFVKVDGDWFFQTLRARIHHVCDLDKGWVTQPMRP
jgi:SnoaL-like domain